MEFEKLQQIIAEVLNVDADEITMDTTFVDDLGADSLDVFQIIMDQYSYDYDQRHLRQYKNWTVALQSG